MASVSATRITKRTTTTTEASSSENLSTPYNQRADRAASPTLRSRIQEKDSLISLNDRLANYIDKVRYLEGEIKRLTTVIRTNEETTIRESNKVKDIYERELVSTRKLIDDISKEKAKQLIDLGNFRAKVDELKLKLATKDKEINSLSRDANAAPTLRVQISELQAKVNELEKSKTDLIMENKALDDRLETAHKQIEEETLARVDLENKLQTLKEELAFRDSVHETELSETRSRLETSFTEVDSRTQKIVDAKLAASLKEIRSEHAAQIAQARRETEMIYENKIINLRQQLDSTSRSSTSSREELRQSRHTIEDLQGQLNRLNGQNALLEGRIKELEKALVTEKKMWADELAGKEAEMEALRERLDEQLREYKDLFETKIALDTEITAYQKLLEGEESRMMTRLNISVEPETSGPGRKRRRMEMENGSMDDTVSEESLVYSFTQTGTATGSVEIKDIGGSSAEGEDTGNEPTFVQLFNNSDKDVSIGGWTMKFVAQFSGAEKDYEFSFKLPRSLTMKANDSITIWDTDSGKSHSPPSCVVMRNQHYKIGDRTTISLLGNDKKEVASREIIKSVRKTTQSKTTTQKRSWFGF